MGQCKNCNKELPKEIVNAGRNYCSRKCRKAAMRENDLKTRGRKRKERYHYGPSFDSDGNSVQ